jgi:hypothetical protein
MYAQTCSYAAHKLGLSATGTHTHTHTHTHTNTHLSIYALLLLRSAAYPRPSQSNLCTKGLSLVSAERERSEGGGRKRTGARRADE